MNENLGRWELAKWVGPTWIHFFPAKNTLIVAAAMNNPSQTICCAVVLKVDWIGMVMSGSPGGVKYRKPLAYTKC